MHTQTTTTEEHLWSPVSPQHKKFREILLFMPFPMKSTKNRNWLMPNAYHWIAVIVSLRSARWKLFIKMSILALEKRFLGVCTFYFFILGEFVCFGSGLLCNLNTHTGRGDSYRIIHLSWQAKACISKPQTEKPQVSRLYALMKIDGLFYIHHGKRHLKINTFKQKVYLELFGLGQGNKLK